MQKLNKKLLADLEKSFKNTPVTEKIAFIEENAELLISKRLFDQYLKSLETAGSELLQKKNGEVKFQEFEIARKRLANLPQVLEKQYKTEAARKAEKEKNDALQAEILRKENIWKEMFKELENSIIDSLKMATADKKIKFEPLNFKIQFEELMMIKPEGIQNKNFDSYLKQISEYVTYNKKLDDRKTQKRKRNIRIYVASGILGLLSITAGIFLSNSKKVDSKKNNDIHASQEFKKTLRFSIESSSNHLFTILPVRQDNLSFLLKDYIRELNFYIEQTNFLDGDDMNLLNKELLKIENNFNDLTAFAGGRDRVSVLSLGEANHFLNTQNEKADKVREAEKDLHKITSKIYILLYKYYSHYQLKTNIPYIKNNLRSKYHKLIFITDNDWELRKLIKEIKEIID
jgi:hypothetical protein